MIVPILVFIIVLIIRVLFLFVVFPCCCSCSGRSQVIALRGRYNDSCRRKHIRWSLAETWSRLSKHRVVYMIVHIHVMKRRGRSQNLLERRVLLRDTEYLI
jgi:hypothetical protein